MGKMDEEKETVFDAIKDGQDWLSSNPEADAEETKEKQKEIEGICSPIIQKYYQGGPVVAAMTTTMTTTTRPTTSCELVFDNSSRFFHLPGMVRTEHQVFTI